MPIKTGATVARFVVDIVGAGAGAVVAVVVVVVVVWDCLSDCCG